MSLKKKGIEEETMELSNGTESDSSESDDDHTDFLEMNEEIQVDFEGRDPMDSDFDGIRQLLNQLFLKSNVNTSELADYIIGQNYIGSVVTQCEDDEDDDDEDDEMTDSNVVLGITTVINLNTLDINCIDQIRSMVDEKAKANATPAIYQHFKNILEDTLITVGFLLNERYVNIPPPIAVPLIIDLMREVDLTNEQKIPFQFTHYMMMLKFYKPQLSKKKSTNSSQSTEYVYSNPEEEVFAENAILEFDYVAQHENALHDVTNDLIPYRKIVIFEAAKLPHIIDAIKMVVL